MICPFCDPEKEISVHDKPAAHLIVTINAKGFHHVHGPISDKRMMTNMIQKIAEEAGLILKISIPKED